MAALSVGTQDEQELARRLVSDVAQALVSKSGWKRRENPRDLGSRRADPTLDFPFLSATLLFRIARQFYADDGPQVGPNLHRRVIDDVFWQWVRSECRIRDAAADNVWQPWGSENHDIQRVHACWAGAELINRDPHRERIVYDDGSTPHQQLTAWTTYLKYFFALRARNGLFVEFFSPTYVKYSFGVLFNIFDFSSDDELRRLAENAITLWWALWAQEQVSGVHGGSKARFYTELMPKGTPMDGLVWLYTGGGPLPVTAKHPAYFPMLMSHYRPPKPVMFLFTDTKARDTYEAWTRVVGLNAGPMSDGRYDLSPELAITRYSFVTPDYVMGAATVPRLSASRWTAISSQNRWNGLVMAGDADNRIYATALPQGGRSTYNAVQAVQSRGTQMVVKLPPPYSRGAGPMIVHVGPHLHRVERGGWIFVEGSAYAAVRPAFGTCDVAAMPEMSPQDCRLSDDASPVILQTSQRADYASFQAFQDAVLAAPLKVTSQDVHFQGLDGAGTVSLSLNGERPPEVNGKPVSAPAGWTLYSPFIRQREGSPIVNIDTRAGKLQLNFQ